MNRSSGQTAKRYYITDLITRNGSVSMSYREKMELAKQLFQKGGHPEDGSVILVNGRRSGSLEIRYVEEEICYMADFRVNEKEEIEEVSYVPVTVSKKRKKILL